MEHNSKNVSSLNNENRNLYVITHIQEAMMDLLKDKEIQDISIIELCNRAGVGRTSFYRNFSSKEDIVKKCVYQKLMEWQKECPAENNLSVKEFLYVLFSHLEVNKNFYGLLYKRNLHEYMKDFLLDLTKFNPDQEMVKAYASAYYAFFVYSWIEVWFRRGMKDTAAELAKQLPNE